MSEDDITTQTQASGIGENAVSETNVPDGHGDKPEVAEEAGAASLEEKTEAAGGVSPDSSEQEIEATLDEMDATFDALEEQLAQLEKAERAINSAYSTGKAERAAITQAAQLDAAEAVAMAGIAMESDVEADEAMKIAVIAEKTGDRQRAKEARKREREARKKANADHAAATKSAKQAYDAIKFSAPNKMGLMRLIQVLFAIHIGITLVWLMLTSRDTFAAAYTVTNAIDWIMVILEGVAFWMFINRYKVARPFVISMAIFGIVAPMIIDIGSGHFNLFALFFNSIFYLVLLFYFIFSSRVKATLVNELGKDKGDYEKDDFVIDRHGWPFIRNLVIYFIVFSVVGHWMEMSMCQLIIMGLVQGEYDPSNTMLWRDWLYPFPMEGAAVVVIALVLYPFFLWLKKKFSGKRRILAYVISFFAGALLCTLIEGGMGLIVNADLQLWDYTDNFCNIGGQVCLQNTMAFGAVAAIITWWVYPMMERWIARIPRDIMNIAAVVVFVFGAIIWSLYLINPPGVDEQNKDPEHAEEILAAQEAEKAQKERSSLADGFNGLASTEQLMGEAVNDSQYVSEEEKAKIAEEIENIKESTQNIERELVGAEAS